MLLQRSGTGIHRDDLFISMNEMPFKNIASQGQRKSMLFAMKLAEFDLLHQHKGFAPLLLLDDVFEKLDQQRMQHLIQWVSEQSNTQVFITDTHSNRVREAFNHSGISAQIIEL